MKPKSSRRRSPSTRIVGPLSDIDATPQDHYSREKARRAAKQSPGSELMAAAKREYLALLEASSVKGKGGRPKKKLVRPATDTLSETDLDQADDE